MGPMGMAAGALFTHKPISMEMPTHTYNITSETHKIDDRSVILNYYSDIYNFLQTYLPEKKHGIVLEIEKKKAVMEQESRAALPENKVILLQESDDTAQFERKIKKLKFMYDNGLLTEEEFAAEKSKLLSQI